MAAKTRRPAGFDSNPGGARFSHAIGYALLKIHYFKIYNVSDCCEC